MIERDLKVNYKDYDAYKRSVKANKIYRKRYTPTIKTRTVMSKTEYYILWTAIWLTFIAFLCFVFKDPRVCLFLIIWLAGLV